MKVYILYEAHGYGVTCIRGVVDNEGEADLWADAAFDHEWEAFELGVISDD